MYREWAIPQMHRLVTKNCPTESVMGRARTVVWRANFQTSHLGRCTRPLCASDIPHLYLITKTLCQGLIHVLEAAQHYVMLQRVDFIEVSLVLKCFKCCSAIDPRSSWNESDSTQLDYTQHTRYVACNASSDPKWLFILLRVIERDNDRPPDYFCCGTNKPAINN